jgi:Subtilase family
MAKHLFLDDRFRQASGFRGRGTPVEWAPPPRERRSHGNYLRGRLERAWKEAEAGRTHPSALTLPETAGVYLSFRLVPGSEKQLQKLERMPRDLRKHGVRLRNVRYEDQDGKNYLIATVWVPHNKRGFFLRKIDKYLNPAEDSKKTGAPSNRDLLACIEDIRASMLESFWPAYDTRKIPGDQPDWCEVWLAFEDPAAEVQKQFRRIASQLEIQVRDGFIRFPERLVLLANANRSQLAQLITASDDIAELRAAHECAGFWMRETAIEQEQWVDDLLARSAGPADDAPAICLLDNGVNRGHPLLEHVCARSDCLAVESRWGSHDHDQQGHGTKMAGLVVYGQLERALQGGQRVDLSHRLESVKFLPPPIGGRTPKDLWGHFTQRAAYTIESVTPRRRRTFCTATTATEDRAQGGPSSWSGAIDALTSGAEDDHQRLFVVAAGNVENTEEMWLHYPESNLKDSIHDPAQAWNALAVGAFTDKVQFSEAMYPDHQPLAQAGDLSPFSATALDWAKTWPIKPDIVLEGGNLLKTPDGHIAGCDDLELLTTAKNHTIKPFSTIWATSAATAQAAWMIGRVQAQYPHAWPETLRGLLVHSASWTDAMLRNRRPGGTKDAYRQLLQTVGHGVPDLERAMSCGGNTLTLISEQAIQPFKLDGTSARCNEMHLHHLPWPVQALLDLPSSARARVRITLSYFVEPSPGEVGWKYRYRYQSHGLRFRVIRPGEPEPEFIASVNAAMMDDDKGEDDRSRRQSDDRWLIGPQTCSRGSVHSDVWDNATAAEVASCNLIAVYPVIGWWRERKHLGRTERLARYSLIVTIETPAEQVDIYSPVESMVAVSIPV